MKSFTLLAVALMLSAFSTVLAQTNFSLTKPMDYNTTAGQIQLDLTGVVSEAFREFKSSVVVTLTEDGTLKTAIPVRFPDAANFEGIDATKWSFVTITESSAKVLRYNLSTRCDDFGTPSHFFLAGASRILWENFIKLEAMPTKGKMRVEFNNIEITNASGAKAASNTACVYEIDFGTGGNLTTAEFKLDTIGAWYNRSALRATISLMYRGPFARKASAKVWLPKGAIVETNNSSIALIYVGSDGYQDAYSFERWDIPQQSNFTSLGVITFRLPYARDQDVIRIGSISAQDWEAKTIPAGADQTLVLKYVVSSVFEDLAVTARLGPNPTNNYFTVSDLSLETSTMAMIIDQSGRIVWQSLLPVGNSKLTIDVNNYPIGVYTLIVGNKICRFMKM